MKHKLLAANKLKKQVIISVVSVTVSTFLEAFFLDVMTTMSSQDSQTRIVLRLVSLDNVAMLDSLLPNPDVFPTGSGSNHEREEGSILKQEITVKDQNRCLLIFVVSKINYFESVSFS